MAILHRHHHWPYSSSLHVLCRQTRLLLQLSFPDSVADRRTAAEERISGNAATADGRLDVCRRDSVGVKGRAIAGSAGSAGLGVSAVCVDTAGSQIDTFSENSSVAVLFEVDVGGRRVGGKVAVGEVVGPVVFDDPRLYLVALELAGFVVSPCWRRLLHDRGCHRVRRLRRVGHRCVCCGCDD